MISSSTKQALLQAHRAMTMLPHQAPTPIEPCRNALSNLAMATTNVYLEQLSGLGIMSVEMSHLLQMLYAAARCDDEDWRYKALGIGIQRLENLPISNEPSVKQALLLARRTLASRGDTEEMRAVRLPERRAS